MRGLLAVLVGLAQVAGPWLCCCGPVRAAATAPMAPAPVETCPHCRKKAPEPPAGPALPDPCPCGGKLSEPAPPPKPDPVADLGPVLPAVGGFVGRPAVVAAAPPAGVCDLPFLPPGARQFVHHVLRC